jgi:hypothetical protein
MSIGNKASELMSLIRKDSFPLLNMAKKHAEWLKKRESSGDEFSSEV